MGFSGIFLTRNNVWDLLSQSPPSLPNTASRIYKVQGANLGGLVLHDFSPSGESSDSYIFESKKKKNQHKI